MTVHTTNYKNSFIQVADDCPTAESIHPPKGKKAPSIAELQFEMIYKNPYKYSSDEILFSIFARRNDLISQELESAKKEFFSKGQACLRASSLAKRYGWGFHFNDDSKVAIYGVESPEYSRFLQDETLMKFKAMRSARAK